MWTTFQVVYTSLCVIDSTYASSLGLKITTEGKVAVDGRKEGLPTCVIDSIKFCEKLKQKDVPSSLKGSNGYTKLLNLFKRSGKIYAKGVSIENFIDCLSMQKIRDKRKVALSELERVLNVTILV